MTKRKDDLVLYYGDLIEACELSLFLKFLMISFSRRSMWFYKAFKHSLLMLNNQELWRHSLWLCVVSKVRNVNVNGNISKAQFYTNINEIFEKFYQK